MDDRVIKSAGFKGKQGAKAGNIGYALEQCPTLCAEMVAHVLIGCFRKQGHPRDKFGGQGWEETEVADTLNVYDNSETRTPIVLVFKERAGCEGGGKGILIGENKSFTLSTLLDEAICYRE